MWGVSEIRTVRPTLVSISLLPYFPEYLLINKCANTELPTNPHDIVEENCCDSTDDHCMLGLCEDCSIPKKFNHTDEETFSNDNTDSSDGETDGKQVTYCKWNRVEKKVQKVTVTEEHSDCVESWKESVHRLLL